MIIICSLSRSFPNFYSPSIFKFEFLLTCVSAYTFDKAITGEISKKIADKQYMDLVKFHNDNPDVLLVYVPVEFDPVDDGVRATDVVFQARIDYFIKNLLESANIPHIRVTGTVEERIAQIEAALANR